jgi:hypothetical protein
LWTRREIERREAYFNERVPAGRAGARNLDPVNAVAVTSSGRVDSRLDTELGHERGVDSALLERDGRYAQGENSENESRRELHRWRKTSFKKLRIDTVEEEEEWEGRIEK